GFFGSSQHFSHTGSVSTQGFFGKDVFVLLYCLYKMLRAEPRRSCKNYHIGEGNRFQIRIETNESAGFGYIDLLRSGYVLTFGILVFLGHQVLVALLDAVLKSVGHRHQLYVLRRAQSLCNRSCTTSATSDYSNLDRIIYGAVITIGGER